MSAPPRICRALTLLRTLLRANAKRKGTENADRGRTGTSRWCGLASHLPRGRAQSKLSLLVARVRVGLCARVRARACVRAHAAQAPSPTLAITVVAWAPRALYLRPIPQRASSPKSRRGVPRCASCPRARGTPWARAVTSAMARRRISCMAQRQCVGAQIRRMGVRISLRSFVALRCR